VDCETHYDRRLRGSFVDVLGPCTKFLDCGCPEDAFRTLADELSGQCFFPRRPPTEVVMLRVTSVNMYPQRGVAWVGDNRLNGDTAAALLHLLHHLAGEVVFERALLEGSMEGSMGGVGDWGVNPAVEAVFKRPQFRPRAKALRPHRVSLATLEAVSALVDYPRDQGMYVGAMDGPEQLRLLAEGSALAGEASGFGLGFVDVVEHLTTGVPSLRRAVPKITVTISTVDSWPAACPKGQETSVEQVGPARDRVFHHRYEMRNVHSGQRFTVTLRNKRTVRGEDWLNQAVVTLQQ
jgi:hypothetical protein